ncbi:forkhead box protein N1 [Brienomyrus brachyistius]|uniref:forkhead box protein N1 n=1 Tax=Brienomyrus brachyistius TaxID=42636 RepID=UPI0020B44081|nr:forkhead box protein N1 [Brienomyrus brachyistius]XP_048837505.1 forkhead box protein N1 [Brienomyrus brachyistius]
MSNDPPETTFSPRAEKSPHSPQPGLLQTSSCVQTEAHEKHGLEDRPLALSQADNAIFRPDMVATERFRRHSSDGATGIQELVPGEPRRFHPYRRQYSDPPGFQQPLDLYQGMEVHEILPVTQPQHHQPNSPGSWSPSMGSVLQASRAVGEEGEFMDAPEESSCYPSQINTVSLPPLEQVPVDFYSQAAPLRGSQYNFQRVAPAVSQNTLLHTLYPKPIYSYSILIFMALRNSKTGSLPVSEIYSFMTENFPYFKTAPDGWKNSVRHNLSLNKCFEKVENKSGGASRKGCLWALNPTKVEKMQEELHKWRRKDPHTVRRSMARPEELERLLGERPQKWKLSEVHSYGQTLLPRGVSPCFPTLQQRLSGHVLRHSQQGSAFPPAQQSQSPWPHDDQHLHHRPPEHSAFPYYPPSRPCMLETHLPYSTALQANSGTPQSMQELLLEGETSNDVDALNPSLTDLQLHGHLWEELKDDSLASDSLLVMASSPPHVSSCMHFAGSEAGEPEAVSDLPTQENGSPSSVHISGLYSATFTNLDCCVPGTPPPAVMGRSPGGSDYSPGSSGTYRRQNSSRPSPAPITITQ